MYSALITLLAICLFIKGEYHIKLKNKIFRHNYSYLENVYYNQKMAAFNYRGSCDIVFVGDSLTDYFQWNEVFLTKKVCNRGIGGDISEGVLNRLSDVVKLSPSKIFIMIGTNDITHNVANDVIENNIAEILRKLHTDLDETEIYIQSILPTGSAEKNRKIITINKKIKRVCESINLCTYVDLYSDFVMNNEINPEYTLEGLHLNANGYEIWINKIKSFID